MHLTAERLRELLSYAPETGVFTWKVRRGGQPAGSVAGAAHNEGYRRISVDDRRYLAHRLAWLYVHGQWPTNDIDHRDSDRSNNRLGNLREATRAENLSNRGKLPDNKSGFKGVSFDAQTGKWVAKISHNGKYRSLGYFSDKEAAAAAYAGAAARLHGEFARVA